jgi:ATP-dependent DNA ligase
MLPVYQPLPVIAKPRPFDGAEWLFELKYDGFRALVYIEQEGQQASVVTEVGVQVVRR